MDSTAFLNTARMGIRGETKRQKLIGPHGVSFKLCVLFAVPAALLLGQNLCHDNAQTRAQQQPNEQTQDGHAVDRRVHAAVRWRGGEEEGGEGQDVNKTRRIGSSKRSRGASPERAGVRVKVCAYTPHRRDMHTHAHAHTHTQTL